MMIVIQVIVPHPLHVVPVVPDVPVPVIPEIPGVSVAQVPKVAEVALFLEVATAHVVPFSAKLPRHRRRLLLLRVEQQLLGSTATSSATASATSSTTSASGGITPEVTPSYLVPRPSGDLAAGQPSRAWGPHHRSASNLLPPRPLGGLHHITPERYAFWTPHDPTLLLPLTILRLALRASFLFFRSSPSLFVPFSFSSFDSFRFFFFSSSFTRGALYKIFKIVLIRAFCLFQVGDYSLSSRGASGWLEAAVEERK